MTGTDGLVFVDFYRDERDRLARALAITIGDGHLAAEAVDEAMARAYQRWRKVAGYDNPSGWVYRVALNWATTQLKRRSRAPHALTDRPIELAAPSEPTVAAAIAQLPVDQRAVVVCRFHLGLSEAETATALGIRPGTAKSRLHRALQKLQSQLAHLRIEED
ncbi:MAG TPA: sigma-70 family RNA polymerase sigma factor [Acidimicrobiales bacterium]|nr:sigma-70 family RNA polymerase sigma factor [Acidimicrobiales bacterium]